MSPPSSEVCMYGNKIWRTVALLKQSVKWVLDSLMAWCLWSHVSDSLVVNLQAELELAVY